MDSTGLEPVLGYETGTQLNHIVTHCPKDCIMKQF